MTDKMSQARIYQPNLMCKYQLTFLPDKRMFILTATNKDEGVGICDEQIIESLWAWVRETGKRLRDAGGTSLPRVLPDMDVFLTFAKDYSCYSVVVVCIDKDPEAFIEDAVFPLALASFCQQAAENIGLKLEGVPDGRPGQAPSAPR